MSKSRESASKFKIFFQLSLIIGNQTDNTTTTRHTTTTTSSSWDAANKSLQNSCMIYALALSTASKLCSLAIRMLPKCLFMMKVKTANCCLVLINVLRWCLRCSHHLLLVSVMYRLRCLLGSPRHLLLCALYFVQPLCLHGVACRALLYLHWSSVSRDSYSRTPTLRVPVALFFWARTSVWENLVFLLPLIPLRSLQRLIVNKG